MTEQAVIEFDKFKHFGEAFVLEKTVEVTTYLRGENGPSFLRLEALRSGCGAGYEIRVYRQETRSVAEYQAGQPVTGRYAANIWEVYDLIRSDMPTAETAIEQALAVSVGM